MFYLSISRTTWSRYDVSWRLCIFQDSQIYADSFKEYANWVLSNYSQGDNDFIVELGSNDGIMLENFANKGIKHLGVEPSQNVAMVAQEHGVNTEVSFFGYQTSKQIIENYGNASAILAANVMCHIPDLNDIAKGAYNLLNEKGVLIFEDHILVTCLKKFLMIKFMTSMYIYSLQYL